MIPEDWEVVLFRKNEKLNGINNFYFQNGSDKFTSWPGASNMVFLLTELLTNKDVHIYKIQNKITKEIFCVDRNYIFLEKGKYQHCTLERIVHRPSGIFAGLSLRVKRTKNKLLSRLLYLNEVKPVHLINVFL